MRIPWIAALVVTLLVILSGLAYLAYDTGQGGVNTTTTSGPASGSLYEAIVEYWSSHSPGAVVTPASAVGRPLGSGFVPAATFTGSPLAAVSDEADVLVDYSVGNFQVEGVREEDVSGFNGTHVFVLDGDYLKAYRAYPVEEAGLVWSVNVGEACRDAAPSVRVTVEVEGARGEASYRVHMAPTGLIVRDGVVYVFCESGFRPYWLPRGAIPLVYIQGPTDVPDYTVVLAVNSSTGNVSWTSLYTGVLVGARLDDRGLVVVTQSPTAVFVDFGPVPLQPIVGGVVVSEEEVTVVGEPGFYTIVALLTVGGLQDYAVVATGVPRALVMAPWGPVVAAWSGDSTLLLSFKVGDGRVVHAGVVELEGVVESQWQLQPLGEYLIVVYNKIVLVEGVHREAVSLAVFRGASLEPASSIDGVIYDQDVHGVRVYEGVLYFVTFRRVDPLFAVNISDPENPRVLGYLEAPGFDEYLHSTPYGLLGVGLEDWRVRVSLYRLVDTVPVAVDRLYLNSTHTLLLEPGGHKAFVYVPGRDLALLPVSHPAPYGESVYYAIRVGPGGLESLGWLGEGDRGYYVGDVLVIVNTWQGEAKDYTVALYDADTLERLAALP